MVQHKLPGEEPSLAHILAAPAPGLSWKEGSGFKGSRGYGFLVEQFRCLGLDVLEYKVGKGVGF